MFELNIEKYKMDELLELFSINTNELYDITTINNKYQLLSNSVSRSNKSKEEIKETLLFLENVKNKLILNLSNRSNRTLINSTNATINQSTSQINPLVSSISSKSSNLFVDKLITIDTRFREKFDNNNTNFTYYMNETIKNISSMELVSLEIPQIYCIMSRRYRNSHFAVSFGENKEHMIILPDIYTIDSHFENYENYIDFVNTINLTFTNSTDELLKRCKFILGDQGHGVTIVKHIYFAFNKEGLDETTMPEYVELDFTKTIDNNDAMSDIRSRLGWKLGFRNDKILLKEANVNEINNNYFVNNLNIDTSELSNYLLAKAKAPIELLSSKYIYLVLDEFTSNKLETIIPHELTLKGCEVDYPIGGNILAKILFDSGSIYYQVNRLVTIKRKYTGPVDIKNMRISLIDEFGRILDIDNSDWSFSIRVSSND
tara:strand:+ start:702 stop:1994 length:1293 start_codon:yes stop_codon:yes gene_type:complete